MEPVSNDLEQLVTDVNDFFKHLHDTQVLRAGDSAAPLMDESLWYYNDRLYYRYLALNGSEEDRDRFAAFLQQAGVQVLSTGRNWRPASNGRMYDWYLRINSLSTADLKRISDHFSPKVGQPSSEEILSGLIHEAAAQLEGKISAIMDTVDETKRQTNATERQLSYITRQNEMLIDLYQAAQQESQQYRERIVDLNERINGLHAELIEEVRGRTSHDEVEALTARYDTAIQDLQNELAATLQERDGHIQKVASLEAELQRSAEEVDHFVAAFEPEKNALCARNTELQNALAVAEAEKNELLDRLQERGAVVEAGKANAEATWRKTVTTLLPQVELLGGTLDTLWREIEDPADALRDLGNIQALKGERVRGLKAAWFERHINRDWRLYWRSAGSGASAKVQAFIGAKTTQGHDIEWLKGIAG